MIIKTGALYNCYVFTASEYYSQSALGCLNSKAAVTDLDLTTTEFKTSADSAGTLTLSKFGAVWNAWPYDDAGTGAMTAQTPDHIMVVGAILGKGMIGR